MSGIKAEYLSHMGDDRMVANAARVSFKKWIDQFSEQDAKLIEYLAKHRHISPFFHPQIQFRIAAPIFVASQAKRHQIGFSLNEVSRRYVDDEPEFWRPDNWRERPDKSIKQGSGKNFNAVDNSMLNDHYEEFLAKAKEFYEFLIICNVAPEQARAVLPQSMLTQWIWTGSLFAWARLCKQRLDAHAQYEIRLLAQQIDEIARDLFPVSWRALMESER